MQRKQQQFTASDDSAFVVGAVGLNGFVRIHIAGSGQFWDFDPREAEGLAAAIQEANGIARQVRAGLQEG